MSDIAAIDQLIDEWLAVDINPESRDEIIQLQLKNDYKTLERKLSNRIAFGTAGLRSSMEAGFAHMNDVTVLQAAQGLIQYLIDNIKGENLSIVVGYDHRFNSQRYAELTASVAISKNVKVYYLGSIDNLSQESIKLSSSAYENNSAADRGYVHTPLVPFAIDTFKASAGVMVTASHNPARDNGYKVYYSNGCQIIPPIDSGIASSIENNLKPWIKDNVWDVTGNFKIGIKNGLLSSYKKELQTKYIDTIKDRLITQPKLNFEFVYTPMHGIGLEIFEKAIVNYENPKYQTVKEQAQPDPTFRTVKFPNPEEKGALDLAIQTADENNYPLVIANDPDADRFSAAFKTRSSSWRQLTGNEIGFLFALYYVEEIIPKHAKFENTYFLNSTVSSQILSSMAEKHGFHFQDTLTGFKWIGNKAIDLKKEGYYVPFGYEEAIGFMFDIVNDKDGISSAIVFLQLYKEWFANGTNDIETKLEQGYKKYGWFKECNGYYKLKDLGKTKEIFEGIRKSILPQSFPGTIGDFEVKAWRDLTIGFDSTTIDNVPLLPIDPTSQMITAILQLPSSEDQVRFTCRGSGTEPKLKVYIEGKSNISEINAVTLARKCWDTLKTEWFKPDINDLEENV
ncbi:Phosphoglucomutase/phosphomannomutase [Scheffersomyces coipomensis]|uniref:Phosphoglucomutase/phosphomannomutase n=1 Tax=Scheffersomyces coipomensis TaxID=1788519 RepID=UPI00315DCD9B